VKGRIAEEAMKMNDQPAILRCSFCNEDQNEVRAMIAGPTVFICDECVEVCQEIVSGKRDQPSASADIIPIAWLHYRGNLEGSRGLLCGERKPSRRDHNNEQPELSHAILQ